MLVTNTNKAIFTGNKIIKEKVFRDVSFYRTYEQALELVDPNDSLALIVRHSQKDSSTGGLTENGRTWATEVGEILNTTLNSDFKNDIKYYSTDTVRTKETAQYIAAGLEITLDPSDIDLSLSNTILRSNYYLRGSNPGNPSWELISKYAYNIVSGTGALTPEQLMNNFGTTPSNNLEYVNLYTSEIVNGILNNMQHKLNIFISHDNMLAPFVITTTGMTINMRYYADIEEEWVNYISGILLIKHSDGTFECIPIKTPYNDTETIYERIAASLSLTMWHRPSRPLADMSSTDKLILLIRHAERGSDTSKQGDITEQGAADATSAGESIRDGRAPSTTTNVIDCDPNDTTYHSTDYVRCMHTAQLIAAARYDTDWDESDYSDIDITNALSYIDGDAFIAHPENLPSSGTHDLIRNYCYNPSQLSSAELSDIFGTTEADAWNKIQNDAYDFLKHIFGLSTNRLNVFVTHDHYIAPMVAVAINKHSDYGTTSTWPDPLHGVAVILHNDNTYEMVPVTFKS